MMLLLENEETILDKWINEKAYECTMFYYCKIVFDLQVLFLQFVRSDRERNFNLYVVKFVKKIHFSWNHCNNVRQLSIHIDDLLKLKCTCLYVCKKFCNQYFSISKIGNPLFSIALGQAHEQNNAVVKGVGGAVGLHSQDMDEALQQWEISDPEAVRLLNEYEKFHHIGPEIDTVKHHEDYPAFQKMFLFYRYDTLV